jgi:HNH endonuclease
MGEVMKSIDANDLIYTEDGRMIEKGTGRECALLSSGDICYADELSGGEEVVNSDNTISLSDSLNNDTLVSDMSYTGYSSDNESTHLEKESKIEEPVSVSDTTESINDMDTDIDSVAEVKTNDFIDSTGNIVVMSKGDINNTFTIEVLNYKNIAVSHRIRSGRNVEDLVKSIQSTGLLRPLMVAPLITEGQYVLLDGYRRLLACVRCGITNVPVVVNHRIKTTEIPVLEAMYNLNKPYNIKDMIDYIEYLEKEKGLRDPIVIEYLLALDSGDYSKLKDVLIDNDPDIVDKLLLGQLSIQQAFKALEKRRSKESRDEKDLRKATSVYANADENGISDIEESGEVGESGEALSEDQLKSIAIDVNSLDSDLEDKSLDEMVEDSNNIKGFEAHKQKVGEREYIDPVIKKSVLARDNFTCKCCLNGGESYVDILDYHHIVPVFLGGADTPDNGITLCVACHRLVHLWGTGDLYLPKEKTSVELSEMTEEDKSRYKLELARFKRIVKIGDSIRNGIAKMGMNRQQYKKEHSNAGIGRRKPGVNGVQEIS